MYAWSVITKKIDLEFLREQTFAPAFEIQCLWSGVAAFGRTGEFKRWSGSGGLARRMIDWMGRGDRCLVMVLVMVL